MTPGPPCCVGKTGYMWVYVEGVVVGETMKRMEFRRNQGFWKKANKSWKFNEESHKPCRKASFENLT